MRLSMIVAATGCALAAGQALGQVTPLPVRTAQEKVDQREALRRAEVAEHQKRKDEFSRNCVKPGLSDTALAACRVAYRRL